MARPHNRKGDRERGERLPLEYLVQRQCRDTARRVGLVAFEAENGVEFDGEQHALPPAEDAPKEGVKVVETRLPGFRLQGKVVRKPLVAVE